jgi:hypothetical protein
LSTVPDRAAIGLLAAEALVTAGVSLHTLNRLKDVFIFRSLRGQEGGLRTLLASLRWEDAALALAAAALAGLIVRLEWRRRAYTRLLSSASPAEAFWLLVILVAWLGHAYLGRGVLLGGDTATHIARFFEVSRGLEAGRVAQWTNYQYAGAPLLWFTGPLTYVAGGVLTALIGNALLSAKALLFTLHLGSGLGFYALLRRFGFRPPVAMLAAVGFAGAFAHLHLFLYRGVIPQAFTIVFLVLLFLAADAMLRRRGSRAGPFVLFALCVAGLIVNHQPHAPFAAIYLALFGVPFLALGIWRWRAAPLLAVAGALGVVSAAVAVLPVLAEAGSVMIEPGSALLQFRVPAPGRLLNLLRWSNARTTWGTDYWTYLGLGAIAFGLAGIFAAATGRLSGSVRATGLGACLCLPLCLTMHNPVVRDVIFLLFFVSLLAACGLEWLVAAGILRGRGLLAACVLALADLASTSVQPVARNDKGFLIEAGRELERVAGDQRVLEMNVSASGELSADIGPDASPLSYFATVQRIAGNHNMAATRLHNFLVVAAKRAEADLRRTGSLSEETARLLGLFNVRRIICHSPIANGCPAPIRSNAADPALGPFIDVPATPLLFSTRLVPLPRRPGLAKPMLWAEDFGGERRPRIAGIEAFLAEFARTEAPEISRKVAAAIPVAGACDPCGAPGPAAPPVIRAYRVGLDRVALDVELGEPGFVQLAHPWFPSTSVTVNGKAVEPIRGALDLLVLPLPSGLSAIRLQDRLTPARKSGIAVSFAGLMGIAFFALLLARSDRRRLTPGAPAPLS